MVNRIKKIEISNYKGINRKEIFFDDLYANKMNLLVAPNGFGKSSLALAFDNLASGNLKLPKNCIHNDDDRLKYSLSLHVEMNGVTHTFEANSDKNEIFNDFSVAVIRSKLKSITKQGFQHMKATSFIGHEDLILIKKIPQKIDFSFYKVSNFKTELKEYKSEVLNLNETLFKDERFLLWLQLFSKKKLQQVRTLRVLNLIKERAENKNLDIDFVSESIVKHPELNSILEKILTIPDTSKLQAVITLYQITSLYRENPKRFENALKFIIYKKWKARVTDTVKMLNRSGFDVLSLKESQGKLLFSLNNHSKLSNGQRDIISFLIQLFSAEYNLIYESNKSYSILVIDEIFDYLDDANIITCQHFICKFIDDLKSFSKFIFPMIFTHLSPSIFDSYKVGKLKYHFLQKRASSTKFNDLRKLIAERAGYNITDVEKDIISKYYLHFSNAQHDQLIQGISTTLVGSEQFHRESLAHLKKFLNRRNDFDPFAICTALRIEFEKFIFKQLNTSMHPRFLDARGTNDKLRFAEENGVIIPEFFILLGIIYNEALHADEKKFHFVENKISAQLENEVIYKMIEESVKICGPFASP